MANNDSGGQVARNFRPGQIAEGLAFDLCRPFMAMARVEQEEDFGIDFIGTLLKQSSKTYNAELSCMIQAKIATAARFHIKGLGVTWLRQLVLPYFPLVIDRAQCKASFYTLNDWHWVIHLSMVDEYVFVLDDDMENDPGDCFFSLGDPIMSWTMQESAHPDFCTWAYSILRPAIEIETLNQRFSPTGRFEKIEGRNFRFVDRSASNVAVNPPQRGVVNYQYAGNHELISSNLASGLIPFAATVANTVYSEAPHDELQRLISILSKFGIKPDRPDQLESILEQIRNQKYDA